MGRRTWTYGEIFDLLKNTATATHIGDDQMEIKGNPVLEDQRAKMVKQIEDMLVDVLSKDNITYVRQYEDLYKDLK